MARVKVILHKTQKKTPTPDVPPELLTHVPPTYVLPTLAAPCEPTRHLVKVECVQGLDIN